MDTCRHVGLETLGGQAFQHYYTAKHSPVANRGISELWISVATGQIVKWFEIYQGSEFKWKYDYDSKRLTLYFSRSRPATKFSAHVRFAGAANDKKN